MIMNIFDELHNVYDECRAEIYYKRRDMYNKYVLENGEPDDSIKIKLINSGITLREFITRTMSDSVVNALMDYDYLSYLDIVEKRELTAYSYRLMLDKGPWAIDDLQRVCKVPDWIWVLYINKYPDRLDIIPKDIKDKFRVQINREVKKLIDKYDSIEDEKEKLVTMINDISIGDE